MCAMSISFIPTSGKDVARLMGTNGSRGAMVHGCLELGSSLWQRLIAVYAYPVARLLHLRYNQVTAIVIDSRVRSYSSSPCIIDPTPLAPLR